MGKKEVKYYARQLIVNGATMYTEGAPNTPEVSEEVQRQLKKLRKRWGVKKPVTRQPRFPEIPTNQGGYSPDVQK